MAGMIESPASQQPQQDPQVTQGVQRIAIAAMKAIHTPQIASGLLQTMHAAQNPAAAIAQASAMVARGLNEKAGGKIPKELYMPALKKIVLMVAELAVSAKLFPVTKQVLQQAMAILMQMKAKSDQAAQQGQPPGQQLGQPPAQPAPAPDAVAPVAQPTGA